MADMSVVDEEEAEARPTSELNATKESANKHSVDWGTSASGQPSNQTASSMDWGAPVTTQASSATDWGAPASSKF